MAMSPKEARERLKAAGLSVTDLTRRRIEQGDTRNPEAIDRGWQRALSADRESAELPWYADEIIRLLTSEQETKQKTPEATHPSPELSAGDCVLIAINLSTSFLAFLWAREWWDNGYLSVATAIMIGWAWAVFCETIFWRDSRMSGSDPFHDIFMAYGPAHLAPAPVRQAPGLMDRWPRKVKDEVKTETKEEPPLPVIRPWPRPDFTREDLEDEAEYAL